MKFDIPASLDEAVTTLTGLDRLLTAKSWQRAAIVAAFVTTQEFGSNQHTKGATSSTLTPVEFAALGIKGLTSKDTVRRYVQAWESTGLGRPRPGEQFTTDDLGPFPPAPTGLATSGEDTESATRADTIRAAAADAGVGASKAVDIASNPKALAVAITADEATARVAREALAARDAAYTGPPPTTPAGKAAKQRLADADAADSMAADVYEAARLLLNAQKEWDAHGAHLDPDEATRVLRTLTDIIVAAEAMKMAMDLDAIQQGR